LNYRKALKKKENYNMAQHFYNEHPREDCEHAIESKPPAGGL
jgi:hypothetical protein